MAVATELARRGRLVGGGGGGGGSGGGGGGAALVGLIVGASGANGERGSSCADDTVGMGATSI